MIPEAPLRASGALSRREHGALPAGGREDRRGSASAAAPPALAVVDRSALARRARRRRERLILASAGLLLAGSLGLVAAGQGIATSQQLHLDGLDQQIANAVTTTQSLEVARARLSAPSRVLGIAEHELHMVAPGHVTYLTPAAPRTRAATGAPRRTSAPGARRGG